MADFNSSLPIRTEAAGDVIIKVADATVTSQQLAIDSGGRVTTKLNDGAGNSVTSQVNGAQRALDVGINVAGVQVDPRAVRALTSTDVVSANLKDGLGNAITSSVAGSTRPLDAALRDAAGALLGVAANPLSVSISSDIVGTEIANYNTAAAVAAGATSSHLYTVTAGKTLLLNQIEASSSGKSKIEVQVETGVATGLYTTRFVQFGSAANSNLSIRLTSVISVAAGVRVGIVRTNRDNTAQDLYSTILGQEV